MMVTRFNDRDGNIYLVPNDNITCCVLYVCGDSGCDEYYHYNIVVGRIEVEVEREQFMKVYRDLAKTTLTREELDIPEQISKTEQRIKKEVKVNESPS